MKITENKLRNIIRQVIFQSLNESLNPELQKESEEVNILYKHFAAYIKASQGNAILTLTKERKTSPQKFIMQYLGFLNKDAMRNDFKKNLKGDLKSTFESLDPDSYILTSDGSLSKKE